MIEAGMVQELDHARIPNAKNIGATFKNPAFDPGRKYSLPYMWGTIGIGYRKSAVNGPIDSWKDIFDSDRFSGRLAILGDAGRDDFYGEKNISVIASTTPTPP